MNGVKALYMAMNDENLVVSYDGGPKVSYEQCKIYICNAKCLFDEKWEICLKEENGKVSS